MTGADGKAYLFPAPSVTEYTLSAEYGGTEIPMTEEDGVFTAVVAQAQAYTGLDLCFMVDTTGSMADELLYLQSELDDVIGRVQAEFPEADISLGLLFYRDEGDEYVVRSSDFTPDIAAQRKFLLAQEADGGGDYPEAVHEALEAALDLSWREGTRKILIPVLDAPPHDQNAQRQDIRAEFGELVYRAAGEGIAVMPVAASGVDVCSQFGAADGREVRLSHRRQRNRGDASETRSGGIYGGISQFLPGPSDRGAVRRRGAAGGGLAAGDLRGEAAERKEAV